MSFTIVLNECEFLGFINNPMIYLYVLKQGSEIKYVGLTINPKKRSNDHRRKRPPHDFLVLESYEDIATASSKEREMISRYSTVRPNGWNLSTGGEYETASGYDRKGIGGAKKGSVPWNKGISGCFSEETIQKMKVTRKGVIHSSKFSDVVSLIRERYANHPIIDGVGKNGPNGTVLTQERAFAKMYASEYEMTVANLWKIVKGKSWVKRKTPGTKS